MNKKKVVKDMGELAKVYCEMDRKKYDVKVCIVFDKKNPTDLKKAYLVVLFQDPKKRYIDKEGKSRRDKKWYFAFKTKANCLELKEYEDFRFVKWYKVEPYTKVKIGWKENSKERERFLYFAQNHKVCPLITECGAKAFEVATARYFEYLSGKAEA